MRQRLGIARCLLNDPRLLILGDPTNGLDPAGILEMEKTCDAVAIIDLGKLIAEGLISELAAPLLPVQAWRVPMSFAAAVPRAIAKAMAEAETAWRQALTAVTIADLASDVDADHGPQMMTGIRGWLNSPAAG